MPEVPTYEQERALLIYRVQQSEGKIDAIEKWRVDQQRESAKAAQDVNAAHDKLRLIASSDRYKAITAVAAAISAAIALVLAVGHHFGL